MKVRNFFVGLSLLGLMSLTSAVDAEDIESMNRVVAPAYTDYILKGPDLEKQNPSKINLLVIGNSLCSHGAAPGLGWNYLAGMAASSLEKDYVHLLCGKVNKTFRADVGCRFSNFADFERDPAHFDLRKIDELLEINPNYIVFQLGENVSDLPGFEKAYLQLIQRIKLKCKGTVVICATPFFPSLDKNKLVQKVCTEMGALLVDLSHLWELDPDTLAKNEVGREDRALWKSDGVGIHPGDYGMETIAQLFFISIQGVEKQKILAK